MKDRRVLRTVTEVEVSPVNTKFGNPTWFRYHFECGHVQLKYRVAEALIDTFLLSESLTTRRKCWKCSNDPRTM